MSFPDDNNNYGVMDIDEEEPAWIVDAATTPPSLTITEITESENDDASITNSQAQVEDQDEDMTILSNNGPLDDGIKTINVGGISTCIKKYSQLVFSDSIQINWCPQLSPDQINGLFNPKKNPSTWMHTPVIAHGHPTLLTPTRWRVQCSTDNFHENCRTVAIYLCRLKNNFSEYTRQYEGVNEVQCLYEVQILDHAGHSVFTKESAFRTFGRGQRYGWKDFAPFDKVKPYLTNGRIHIRVTLKSMDWVQNLDLNALNEIVTIKTLNTEIAKLPKIALMKNCQFFRELLFRTGVHTDELVLPDQTLEKYSMATLRNLFQYLELKSCDMVVNKDFLKLPDLWDVACQLNLEGLKVDIFDSLTDCIRLGNVTALVIFVCKNSEIIRKANSPYAIFYNRIKKFVTENVEKISETPSFKKLCFENAQFAEEFANLFWEDDLKEPTEPREIILIST